MILHELEIISSMAPLQEIDGAWLVIHDPGEAAPHLWGEPCQDLLPLTTSSDIS